MYCPKCGKEMPDGSAFCSNCGASMSGTASTAGQPPSPASAALGGLVGFLKAYFRSPVQATRDTLAKKDLVTPLILLGIQLVACILMAFGPCAKLSAMSYGYLNIPFQLWFMGSLAIIFSLCIGGVLGAVSGFYGKLTDSIIMRFMDILLAIPSMLLATAIVAALGTSLVNVLIAIGIAYIPTFARTVRASVLTVKDQDYIEAARSIGCNDREIIFKYIIPNAMAPIIVQATLGLAGAILSIAGLSFLGLGIQPPTPEWGAMLSNARVYIRDAWHVTVIPGLGIMLTILSLNLMGDGLRDALDPRLKN